jgi:hypothetical protein
MIIVYGGVGDVFSSIDIYLDYKIKHHHIVIYVLGVDVFNFIL